MTRLFKQMLALMAFGLLLPVAQAATPAAAPAAAAKPVAGLGEIGADGMPMLARTSNCAACHAIGNEKKMLGPSWMDVSRKYKGAGEYEFAGKKYPLEQGLFMKVSKGGAGVWGTMPMPANSPMVKDEDMKILIHFVLGLAK
jgi:cytochrome c